MKILTTIKSLFTHPAPMGDIPKETMQTLNYNKTILDVTGNVLLGPNGPLTLAQAIIIACSNRVDADKHNTTEGVEAIGRVALAVTRGEDLHLSQVEIAKERVTDFFGPVLAYILICAMDDNDLGITPAAPILPPADDAGDECCCSDCACKSPAVPATDEAAPETAAPEADAASIPDAPAVEPATTTDTAAPLAEAVQAADPAAAPMVAPNTDTPAPAADLAPAPAQA